MSKKCHIDNGSVRNGYGAMSIYSKLNKIERMRVFIESSC
jgi:hypothetical protein